ncbi:hypothetical protein C8Q78DRAFT_1078315 [Trametes maxima]|nr:hypothetical protein C8Q78DRAFT_1078315 [Trametes maxima]
MDYSSIDEMLGARAIEWYEQNPTRPWSDEPSYDGRPSSEEFNNDMDQRSYIAPMFGDSMTLADTAQDWRAMLRPGEAPFHGTFMGTYSDSAITTIPESVASTSSEETVSGHSNINFFSLGDNLVNADNNVYATTSIEHTFAFGIDHLATSPDFPRFVSLEETPLVHQSEAGLSVCGGHWQEPHASGDVYASTSWDSVSSSSGTVLPIPQSPSIAAPVLGLGDLPVKPAVNNNKKPPRRRKQSTERIHICPMCGCGSARKHNLEMHIKAVHENVRSHVCSEPRCRRTFTRKHDLKRHYQSKHTDQGSPRRKAPKA